MNTNSYPSGRWTTPSRNQTPSPERIPNSFTQLDLGNARLSQLFWTAPEAELLFDAVDRLDRRLRGGECLPEVEFAPETAQAA